MTTPEELLCAMSRWPNIVAASCQKECRLEREGMPWSLNEGALQRRKGADCLFFTHGYSSVIAMPSCELMLQDF